MHQGGGGQTLRVQRPVQQAGEEERLQQDTLGVSPSTIITLQDSKAELTIQCSAPVYMPKVSLPLRGAIQKTLWGCRQTLTPPCILNVY